MSSLLHVEMSSFENNSMGPPVLFKPEVLGRDSSTITILLVLMVLDWVLVEDGCFFFGAFSCLELFGLANSSFFFVACSCNISVTDFFRRLPVRKGGTNLRFVRFLTALVMVLCWKNVALVSCLQVVSGGSWSRADWVTSCRPCVGWLGSCMSGDDWLSSPWSWTCKVSSGGFVSYDLASGCSVCWLW